MGTVTKSGRPVVLAMEIAFRTALLGVPSVDELRTEYGVSRATAYRYRRHVTQALYGETARRNRRLESPGARLAALPLCFDPRGSFASGALKIADCQN